jgi:tryptophan synthase beta chain
MLYPNVEELRQNYLITAEPSFQAEFDSLLKEYVGPPLYFAGACLKNTIQKYI